MMYSKHDFLLSQFVQICNDDEWYLAYEGSYMDMVPCDCQEPCKDEDGH
jgi:hypothetical protein